jgi:hypothetical protein
MNEQAASTLASLISRYGSSVALDPLRCEALLRDTCPRCRREIFVLVNAVRQQIPADLLSPRHSLPPELFRGFLVKRLQDELAFSDEAARWAVDTWAFALGVGPASVISSVKDTTHPGASAREGIAFPEDAALNSLSEKRQEWARDLESKNEKTRLAAIERMRKSPDAEIIRLLITSLENSSWRIRVSAFNALIETGEPAVPFLIEALGDSHERIVTSAAIALGALRPLSAVEPLMTLLENPTKSTSCIIWALGEITDTRAITPLTSFLRSTDGEIRYAAEIALRKFS